MLNVASIVTKKKIAIKCTQKEIEELIYFATTNQLNTKGDITVRSKGQKKL